jgi:uncharacterized BrkB/YihY/UPF0761 family membrane protein
VLALFGLIVVLLVQATLLADASAWVTRATAPVWLVVVVVYFVWAVRRLTDTRLAVRDLLPGAILTACGLVALMFPVEHRDGALGRSVRQRLAGFGVIMAVCFWLGLGSTLIVASASLAPVLSERRTRHDADRW